MRAIDPVALIQKVRVKANWKLWFDAEIISSIKKETNFIQDIKRQA